MPGRKDNLANKRQLSMIEEDDDLPFPPMHSHICSHNVDNLDNSDMKDTTANQILQRNVHNLLEPDVIQTAMDKKSSQIFVCQNGHPVVEDLCASADDVTKIEAPRNGVIVNENGLFTYRECCLVALETESKTILHKNNNFSSLGLDVIEELSTSSVSSTGENCVSNCESKCDQSCSHVMLELGQTVRHDLINKQQNTWNAWVSKDRNGNILDSGFRHSLECVEEEDEDHAYFPRHCDTLKEYPTDVSHDTDSDVINEIPVRSQESTLLESSSEECDIHSNNIEHGAPTTETLTDTAIQDRFQSLIQSLDGAGAEEALKPYTALQPDELRPDSALLELSPNTGDRQPAAVNVLISTFKEKFSLPNSKHQPMRQKSRRTLELEKLSTAAKEMEKEDGTNEHNLAKGNLLTNENNQNTEEKPFKEIDKVNDSCQTDEKYIDGSFVQSNNNDHTYEDVRNGDQTGESIFNTSNIEIIDVVIQKLEDGHTSVTGSDQTQPSAASSSEFQPPFQEQSRNVCIENVSSILSSDLFSELKTDENIDLLSNTVLADSSESSDGFDTSSKNKLLIESKEQEENCENDFTPCEYTIGNEKLIIHNKSDNQLKLTSLAGNSDEELGEDSPSITSSDSFSKSEIDDEHEEFINFQSPSTRSSPTLELAHPISCDETTETQTQTVNKQSTFTIPTICVAESDPEENALITEYDSHEMNTPIIFLAGIDENYPFDEGNFGNSSEVSSLRETNESKFMIEDEMFPVQDIGDENTCADCNSHVASALESIAEDENLALQKLFTPSQESSLNIDSFCRENRSSYVSHVKDLIESRFETTVSSTSSKSGPKGNILKTATNAHSSNNNHAITTERGSSICHNNTYNCNIGSVSPGLKLPTINNKNRKVSINPTPTTSNIINSTNNNNNNKGSNNTLSVRPPMLRHISQPNLGGAARTGLPDLHKSHEGSGRSPGQGREQSNQRDVDSDLAKLKATATRLRLTTRRDSYISWLEERKGDNAEKLPPLSKWKMSGGSSRARTTYYPSVGDDNRLTVERKTRIEKSLEWLRTELQMMRSQDQALAKQFLALYHDIHRLRVSRSCQEHRDLLDEVQSDLEDLYEFSNVLDLPRTFLLDTPLKHVGVTRLNISARRFSAC